MKKSDVLIKNIVVCVLAFSIPLFLFIDGIQARRYSILKSEVIALEKEQAEVIEKNKDLITGISLLSCADRIEYYAANVLGMRLAESNEIIRVEMQSQN